MRGRGLVNRAFGRFRRQGEDGSPHLAGVPPETRRLIERDLATVGPADREIVERVISRTMTGVPRVQALIDAVRYCVRREVPGAFAECGVWLGGSVLAMLLTLQDLGVEDRDVYLYDTFEGMPPPTEHDTSPFDPPAVDAWKEAEQSDDRIYGELFGADVFNEDKVRETVLASGYPEERLHFVKGKVEETLPASAPSSLALLRLDTDWYESTRHELRHLYPLLSPAGVLIIDDYGHWDGSRKAVDEYFADDPVLLSRIDYAARMTVKR
jgi:O-methyltransferase